MIDVVGVGADGLAGLPSSVRQLVEQADVVLGGTRHLADLPEGIESRAWPSPLRAGLPTLLDELEGRRVVALASGDPLVAGIGSTLIEVLGVERVRIHPAVSSVSLARAQMGWSAESSVVVRLRGRDLTPLRRELAEGVRLVVLSADYSSPREVAECLVETGHGASTMTVLSDLGAADESWSTHRADEFTGEVPRLNLVCVEVHGAGSGAAARTPGLPDDLYATTCGQLTKRHIRATALAMLGPRPGELLWDLGAGSGSIAIEWCRSHPGCRAVAVERDPDRARLISENAARLGADLVRVVRGDSEAVLDDLEQPDAVFVGGGASRELIDAVWAVLPPGGRLVVHAVTLETETLLIESRRDLGGELFEIAVREAEKIGRYTGWSSSRPVQQWVAYKPDELQEDA